MLTVVVMLKAVMEIAGLSLFGQGVLFVFAGAGREQNVFYRVIKVITAPMVRVTRAITPRKLVPDAYIGVAAFFLVAGLWFALTIVKVRLVLEATGRLPS